MGRKAGVFGVLPRSTARRILQGRTVPATMEQFQGFLHACGVDRPECGWDLWVRAYDRAGSALTAP